MKIKRKKKYATPIVQPITISTNQNQLITIELVGISPVNNPLTYVYSNLIPINSGIIQIIDNRAIFTPNTYFNGIVTFDYKAIDEILNLESEPMVVTINVIKVQINIIDSDILLTQIIMNNFSWPVYITKPINITFRENIIINNPQQYFIISSNYITIYGNCKTVFIDGVNSINFPTSNNSINGYLGLFQNGISVQNEFDNNCYDNIKIIKLGIVSINNSNLNSNKEKKEGSGWLLQSHWGNHKKKTYVYKCFSSSNLINNYCGGLIGSHSYAYVNNSISKGTIKHFAGGIFGAYTHGTSYKCISYGKKNKQNDIIGYKSKVHIKKSKKKNKIINYITNLLHHIHF